MPFSLRFSDGRDMNTHRLTKTDLLAQQAGSKRGLPVSHILMESGQVSSRVMLGALAEAERLKKPLDHVIAAEAIVSRESVLEAQAQHYGALALRRDVHPPSAEMAALLSASFCLEKSVYPWMRLGDTLVLATSRPDSFAETLNELPPGLGPVMMALTLEADIHAEIARNMAQPWRDRRKPGCLPRPAVVTSAAVPGKRGCFPLLRQRFV